MKKIATIVAIAGLIAFGHLGVTAYAADTGKSDHNTKAQNKNDQAKNMHDTWVKSHELSKLKGKDIQSTDGKKIASVKDFLLDNQGRVQFALVGAGGKTVAVPYEALNLSNDGKFFTINMNKDQLASAPQFNDKTVVDRTWAESVYRYFGVQPRWSEEQGMTQPNPMNTPQGTTERKGTYQ